ncbi:RelA/SpoT family protein [Spiroplasma endosymbiont of Othius punctulatus]|uniref:RelA/SpoT family protein n=1 Tax=Spiroplasma endosymbiont of Othius punctulatus TaxID=3066289 RepID=UPI0030D43FCB
MSFLKDLPDDRLIVSNKQGQQTNVKKMLSENDFHYKQIETLAQLMEVCEQYIKDKKQLRQIEVAYYFAEKKHAYQKRKSGEPFIYHPLSTAYFLAQWKMGPSTIICGLLHDTIEDTETTFEEIDDIFGNDIASITEAVTKVSYFTKENRDAIKSEYLKKLFVSMVQDIRVIIVKIADRMHNILTLSFQSPEKQKKIANETLEIYVPLAARMGIKIAKTILEDNCFRVVNPLGFEQVTEKMQIYNVNFEQSIQEIVNNIQEKIFSDKTLKKTVVFGRTKTISSIYKKVYNLNKDFDEINDILAVRIITENKYDCYKILAMVHEMYIPIMNRFKDYIANPKNNMYQSIHTNVVNKDGNVFEVQMRTFDMNDYAEFGAAAHWRYKAGDSIKENVSEKQKKSDEKMDMFSRLLMLEQTATQEIGKFDVFFSEEEQAADAIKSKKTKGKNEIEDIVKSDFLAGSIFVITPSQKVYTLPYGSSAIDLAYKIGPEVGNRLSKAKSNGVFVPIFAPLNSGDVVDVITNEAARPSKRWIKFIKTINARQEIEAAVSGDEEKQREKQHLENLKTIRQAKAQIDNYIVQNNLQSKVCGIEELLTRCQQIGYESIYDFILDVGIGSYTVETAIKMIYLKDSDISSFSNLKMKKSTSELSRKQEMLVEYNDVEIAGIRSLKYEFAECCLPIPPEDIVAVRTPEKKIWIHKEDCKKNQQQLMKENTALKKSEAKWIIDNTYDKFYYSKIFFLSDDRKGIFLEVTQLMQRTDIRSINLKVRTETETFGGEIIVAVNSVTELNDLINKMSKIPNVNSCERIVGAISN